MPDSRSQAARDTHMHSQAGAAHTHTPGAVDTLQEALRAEPQREQQER